MTAPQIPTTPNPDDLGKLRGLAVLLASIEIRTADLLPDDLPARPITIRPGVLLVSRRLRADIDRLLSWFPEIR